MLVADWLGTLDHLLEGIGNYRRYLACGHRIYLVGIVQSQFRKRVEEIGCCERNFVVVNPVESYLGFAVVAVFSQQYK
jgi:hypothetical protein